MSTVSILSILVYPQSGYLLVYHMGLSLVHFSSFFFFLFFLCHVFVVKYKKQHGALAMAETKL